MAIKFSDISGTGIPFGNNAGRPANPVVGKPYFNGQAGRLELYTSASGWQNIVQETPSVAAIIGTFLESTNSGTITVSGGNFNDGAIVSAIGTNGVEVNAASTTYNSVVQLTASFTGLVAANEPYDIKVTNPSNLFGIIPDALYVNQSPIWQTAAGSLGSYTEITAITLSALSATDPESTAITFALASGSTLPTGITLSSSGVISGTLPDIESNTTYTFTVNATDGANTVPRTFSLTSLFTVYGAPTPQAWYIANDLTSVATGTVWTNRGSGFTVPFTFTNGNGTLVTNWRNGHKSLTGSYGVNAPLNGQSVITQSGDFTMLTVVHTNQSGFGPYFGIGEWWTNYSSDYPGYYAHGLYASGWGNFTATPAVQGMRHPANTGTLVTYSNGNFAGETITANPDPNGSLSISGGEANVDGIAEILVWNTQLTNAQMNAVKDALRAKYAF
jgi:hypothetical protein